MEVTRIFDLLPHYKSRFQHKEDVIAGKEDDRWVKYDIDQYIGMTDNISYGLIVVGENQKYAAALLVPDFNHLRSWSATRQIDYDSDTEIVSNPEIKKQFKKEVDHYNSSLGNTEKIMRFRIMENEWTIDSGELTASLKLKRAFIQEKYKGEIEALFS